MKTKSYLIMTVMVWSLTVLYLFNPLRTSADIGGGTLMCFKPKFDKATGELQTCPSSGKFCATTFGKWTDENAISCNNQGID